MKTGKYMVAIFLICGLGCCAALIGRPTSASDIPVAFQGEIMDNVCARAGSHADVERSKGITDSKDCVLNCLKDGAVLVLHNPVNGSTYRLNTGEPIISQDRLLDLAGAKVRIVGSLDENAGVIWHIQSVQRL